MSRFKYQAFIIVALLQSILFLTGCKLVEWGNSTFHQAGKLQEDFSVPMQPYIKSTVIYDKLSLVAEFSALFLTDHARIIYLDYFCHRNLKSAEEKAIDKQRLLTENDYYITFYVVGYQPASMYPSGRSMFSGEYHLQGPLLGNSEGVWKATLIVDGNEYVPDDVRSVELPIEYQYFFGTNYSQFKTAYRIRFDARDSHNKEILASGKHNVALKFSSVNYETRLRFKGVSYKM